MVSTGVRIVAIVEILLGIFALIGGVVHLLFGIGGLVSFSGSNVTLGQLANALGDVFTVQGLILFAAGAGLWMGRRWGWTLSVVIILIGILTSIPVLALGSVGALPSLIVTLVVLYFLARPGIRREFK